MRAAWWWIDRWRQSTAYTDMTAEEQGLYRNLCDEVWLRDDHVIPDDPRILARVSGDPEAWARSGAKVLGWMERTPQGWTNQTALEVIHQSKRRADKQQRYRNRDGNAPGNAEGNEAGNYPGSPSPSPSPSKDLSSFVSPPVLSEQAVEVRQSPEELVKFGQAVVEEWHKLRGSDFPQPSQRDFHTLTQWQAAGIPLRVVLRGMADLAEVARRTKRNIRDKPLAYFDSAVQEAFRLWRKAVQAPA